MNDGPQDFVAFVAILALAISASCNLSQWEQIKILSRTNDKLTEKIEVMERTLLLQN